MLLDATGQDQTQSKFESNFGALTNLTYLKLLNWSLTYLNLIDLVLYLLYNMIHLFEFGYDIQNKNIDRIKL